MLPLRLVIDTNVLVYDTPRGGDEVLAFDPGRLKTVPASALLEQVQPVPRQWSWQSARASYPGKFESLWSVGRATAPDHP
jgi:hypothetical protein